MIIDDNEIRDLGLNHNLIMRRFNKHEFIRIGDSKYIVESIMMRHDSRNVYKLTKIRMHRRDEND